MQTIDLAIDFRDLMSKEDAANIEKAKMQERVISIIEQAVVSSFGPSGAIEQRKVDRILDLLESTKESGKLIIDDKKFADLQEMWEGRKFKVAAGAERKLIQRIDRRLCPDVYKENEVSDA